MEILNTIALLCQIANSNVNPETLQKMQHTCQKYYIKCLDNHLVNGNYKTLAKCVVDKK